MADNLPKPTPSTIDQTKTETVDAVEQETHDTPKSIVINNGPSTLSLIAAMTISTVLGVGLLFGGFKYFNGSDPSPQPGPPAPPVVEKVVIKASEAKATLNGKTVDEATVNLLVDLANRGDGNFLLEVFPENANKFTRSIVVSGGDIPPVPPGPKPKPDPKPDPDPNPDPAPIPVDGFRVLVVYENNPTDPAGVLTKEQRGAMSSQAVRSYLDSKCAKGKDGKTPEWRMWDQHVDVTNETGVWKDAMNIPRNVLPWLIISDGKIGYNGPFPENEAEFLALLKKYGDK